MFLNLEFVVSLFVSIVAVLATCVAGRGRERDVPAFSVGGSECQQQMLKEHNEAFALIRCACRL